MTDLIGRILDNKYRIVRVIGVGGMGTVYEAEHILISWHVALKILSQEFVADPDVVERFFLEATSASAIGHPNIVEIYDVGREDDKTVYIVMELLKGTSLADRIDAETRLDPTAAAAIAVQVLSALCAAHGMGIVHRDLKAANVFLAVDSRDRQEVKLLDFGIAKIGRIGAPGFGLTQDGLVMGTPFYVSPEQARGANDLDARIDIWGVGVMLYEMLTGTLPYDGENYNELLSRILLEEPRPMLEIVPELPPELVAIVEKAMQKDRNNRYASAEAMLDSLTPFVAHAAQDLLSSAVLKTIKGIPVTPVPGGGARRLSDPLADTSASDMLDTEVMGDRSRARRRRLLVSLALAVGLGVLLAGITIGWLLGDTDEAAAEPAGVVATVGADAGVAAPMAAPEEHVAIGLRELPAGAVILADGGPEPIAVKAKPEPIAVKAKPEEAAVEEAPEVVAVEEPSEPRERRTTTRKQAQQKPKVAWAENPFD
jgi:serine/threonine-protein kinase